MKGNVTCKICGKDFPVKINKHGIGRDAEKKGFMPALTGTEEGILYDVFNCPHCGCQYVAQERKHVFIPEPELERSCANCKHGAVKMQDFPCAVCSHSFMDYFEEEEEEEENNDE